RADLTGAAQEVSAPGGTEGRFHVYDALARLMERAAEGTGLLVVLDDLHLADEASLLALGFVAELIRSSGVLIVGTYREGELAPDGGEDGASSATALAELTRLGNSIHLSGLATDDVRDLIAQRTNARAGDELAKRLHEVTSGNPLFVSELLDLLESEDKLSDPSLGSSTLPLPTGIRDAISRRVAPLPPAARGRRRSTRAELRRGCGRGPREHRLPLPGGGAGGRCRASHRVRTPRRRARAADVRLRRGRRALRAGARDRRPQPRQRAAVAAASARPSTAAHGRPGRSAGDAAG